MREHVSSPAGVPSVFRDKADVAGVKGNGGSIMNRMYHKDGNFNLYESLLDAGLSKAEADSAKRSILDEIEGKKPAPGCRFVVGTYADERYRIMACIIREPWYETTSELRVEYLAG